MRRADRGYSRVVLERVEQSVNIVAGENVGLPLVLLDKQTALHHGRANKYRLSHSKKNSLPGTLVIRDIPSSTQRRDRLTAYV